MAFHQLKLTGLADGTKLFTVALHEALFVAFYKQYVDECIHLYKVLTECSFS